MRVGRVGRVTVKKVSLPPPFPFLCSALPVIFKFLPAITLPPASAGCGIQIALQGSNLHQSPAVN